jgi:hypothetical protein
LFKNLKFLHKIRYFGSKNFTLRTQKSVCCIKLDGAHKASWGAQTGLEPNFLMSISFYNIRTRRKQKFIKFIILCKSKSKINLLRALTHIAKLYKGNNTSCSIAMFKLYIDLSIAILRFFEMAGIYSSL